MNYDFLEALYNNEIIGTKVYESLKKSQLCIGALIFKGVMPQKKLSFYKKRCSVLCRLTNYAVDNAIVDITCAGEKGNLYADLLGDSVLLKFKDLECGYSIGRDDDSDCKTIIRMNRQDGYYFIYCDRSNLEILFYDKIAMQCYRGIKHGKLPGWDELEKDGILPTNQIDYSCDSIHDDDFDSYEKFNECLPAKLFSLSFQDGGNIIFEYLKKFEKGKSRDN